MCIYKFCQTKEYLFMIFFCFIQKPEGYFYDSSWFFMFYSRSWMFYYMYLKKYSCLIIFKKIYSRFFKIFQDFSRFFMDYSRSWTTFMFYHWFSCFIFKIFHDYWCFIKDLKWFLIYVFHSLKIHVLSIILMISLRFFKILNDILLHFIKYIFKFY